MCTECGRRFAPSIAQRVEPFVAHCVVVRPPVALVRLCQPFEFTRDVVGVIADCFVAADQIRVRVDQDRIVIAQPSAAVEIEEHGAAAEERLDVAVEGGWIEAPETGRSCRFPPAHFNSGLNGRGG